MRFSATDHGPGIIENNSYLTYSMPVSPAARFNLPPLPLTAEAAAALAPTVWHAAIGAEPAAAAEWMLQVARLGHPNAQTILGQWLLDGHGVSRNPNDALAWFLKAAVQAHPMAINMAGRCFENGWGTTEDAFAAANWYHQAAKKGLDAGMYNYANLLASGLGVTQDAAEALQWYRRAAAMGHAKSMTKLGFFYEDGRTWHALSPGLSVAREVEISGANSTTPACWPRVDRWARRWTGCARYHSPQRLALSSWRANNCWTRPMPLSERLANPCLPPPARLRRFEVGNLRLKQPFPRP